MASPFEVVVESPAAMQSPPHDAVQNTSTASSMPRILDESPENDTTQTKKSFLDLPAEIRNRVYELALTRPRKLRICDTYDHKMRLNSTRIFPSIVRTCRTIYDEANPVLYGENTFYTLQGSTMSRFLERIGRCVRHIRLLDIGDLDLWYRYNFDTLKSADILEKIVVQLLEVGAGGDPGVEQANAIAAAFQRAHESRKDCKDKKQMMDIIQIGSVRESTMIELKKLLG